MKHNYSLYLFIFLLLIIISFLFAIHKKEEFANKKQSTTIITRTRSRPVFYPVYSSPTVITTTPGTVVSTRTSTIGAVIAFIIIIGIIILIVYLSNKGGYTNSNYNTETIVIHKGGFFKKK